VITFAIDTSEARGSVAVLHEGLVVGAKAHRDGSDYSGWLLPAVEEVLAGASTKMEHLDLLAVCTGPGSFTGLRVGLTAVKAWAEVYDERIVGVPRLEAVARSLAGDWPFIAASYDAQRGQLFAALYKKTSGCLQRVGDELVISPDDLVSFVGREAGGQRVAWIGLDPELVSGARGMDGRIAAGDKVLACSDELAPNIGVLAEERAIRGQFSDPLILDANYVRRSDAEIFWKGSSAGAR
jgi:tRNA threonylcarbamoyladenosine biosynthesis protein TsaB